MNLFVYEQTDVFEALQAEWNDLVQRSSMNTVFSTWEWMSTWWAAYQPGTLHVVTYRTDDGTLVGIAPWFLSESAPGKRVLSTIGCKEVTDYLDLIVDVAHTDAVLTSFASYLRQNADKFDTIFLCNIPEDAISFQHLPAKLKTQGFNVQLQPEDVCPVVTLPDDWSDYLAQLDKKQRHEVRRKLRRALGQNSDIDWYIVDQTHDLDTQMSHFLRLMAASDPEKATFLEDANNLRFFRSLAPIMLKNGWLQLSFLTVNGEPAATYLNFDYADEVLVYNSGLDQQNYGHLSPGIVLLSFTIQHAIETGHRRFDFLQGNEEYKYRMGGQDRRVFNLEATLDQGA